MKQTMHCNRIQSLSVVIALGLLSAGCGPREDPPRDEGPVLFVPEEESTQQSKWDEDSTEVFRTVSEETDESGTTGESESAEEPVYPEGIVVHVCGAVICPGVYAFPKEGNYHVQDAVDAAGGMLPEAAADYLNLAEPIVDGEKIVIPFLEEVADDRYGILDPEAVRGRTSGNVEYSDTRADDRQETGADNGLVNLNTAGVEELSTLPGIGEGKAALIVAHRKKYGNFTAITDLMNVSGIGEATYEGLKDRICVE